jgi:hypothetical protein
MKDLMEASQFLSLWKIGEDGVEIVTDYQTFVYLKVEVMVAKTIYI